MDCQTQTVQRAIDALPRHRLSHLPTPLQLCTRLTTVLNGPRIWVKRDDMTGLALGGNKTRYLEFTLAEATAQGYDAVVLSAVVQSNHCRQFAAACARLNLKGVIVLREDDSTMGRSHPAQGNYLLDRLYGIDIRVASPADINETIEQEKQRLNNAGHKTFTGLSGLLSRVAYIQCALEIERQCQTESIAPGHLVIGSGGNSLAGLLAGFALLGRPLRLLGTPQSKMSQATGISEQIARQAEQAAAHIGLTCSADPALIKVTDEYVGRGFGHPEQRTLDAIRLLARHEGILVDPTYSGKAFACLVDQLRQGRFSNSEDIIFVHTGGTPLLFAYGEELLV